MYLFYVKLLSGMVVVLEINCILKRMIPDGGFDFNIAFDIAITTCNSFIMAISLSKSHTI